MKQVAKGFSFVLVSVVMVMMTVFGLLSLTSARADLRLSQKAAAAQQVYYEMDSRAERLYAACRNASAAAGRESAAFVTDGLYRRTLPDDFYPCLRPLAQSAAGGAEGEKARLQRGVYFYELEKQLRGVPSISVSVDQSALGAALAGTGTQGAVVTVRYTVRSARAANNSLSVVLVCPYGGASVPEFTVTKWASAVSGLTVGGSSHVNVWSGN